MIELDYHWQAGVTRDGQPFDGAVESLAVVLEALFDGEVDRDLVDSSGVVWDIPIPVDQAQRLLSSDDSLEAASWSVTHDGSVWIIEVEMP